MHICSTLLLLIFKKIIIESVDSISRDEGDAPLTQYITNAGISHTRYTICILNTTMCSMADFQWNECITSQFYVGTARFGILLSSSADLAR